MGTARSMDRRSFLKGATVAGAAAAAAGTLGLAGCAPQDKETVAAASGDLVLDGEKFTNAKWNFEIPPEPVDESKIGNTVECEILVIGAGVSGLVTATSAVEEGADVVEVASSDGPVSRGGSNAAFNTRLTHELGLDFTREEIEPIFQEIFALDSFRLDQEKWRLVYNESGNAHELAHGQDGALRHLRRHREQPARRRHRLVGRRPAQNARTYPDSFVAEGAQAAGASQQIVVEALTEEIQKGGGQVFFSTTAVQLDREGDNTGRVTGCVAKRDGEYTRYKATKGRIVLATGDFSQDKDMVAKYCPWRCPSATAAATTAAASSWRCGSARPRRSTRRTPPCWPRWAATKCCPAAGGRGGRAHHVPRPAGEQEGRALLQRKLHVRLHALSAARAARRMRVPHLGRELGAGLRPLAERPRGRRAARHAGGLRRLSRRCSTPTPTGPPPTSTPASTPRWPRTP